MSASSRFVPISSVGLAPEAFGQLELQNRQNKAIDDISNGRCNYFDCEEDLMDDPMVAEAAVSFDSNMFEILSETLRSNPIVAATAIAGPNSNPKMLEFASEEIKNQRADGEFTGIPGLALVKDIEVWRFVGDLVKTDETTLLKVIKSNPKILEKMDPSFRKNIAFMNQAVSLNPAAIHHADPSIKGALTPPSSIERGIVDIRLSETSKTVKKLTWQSPKEIERLGLQKKMEREAALNAIREDRNNWNSCAISLKQDLFFVLDLICVDPTLVDVMERDLQAFHSPLDSSIIPSCRLINRLPSSQDCQDESHFAPQEIQFFHYLFAVRDRSESLTEWDVANLASNYQPFIALCALRNNPFDIQYISPKGSAYEHLAFFAVAGASEAYLFVDAGISCQRAFREKAELFNEEVAIYSHVASFSSASERVLTKKEKEFLGRIERDPAEFLKTGRLQQDEFFTAKALERNPDVFYYIHESMQRRDEGEDLFRQVAQKEIKNGSKHAREFKRILALLAGYKLKLQEKSHCDKASLLKYFEDQVPAHLRKDRAHLLELVIRWPELLSCVDETIRDQKFVLNAIFKNPTVFLYTEAELVADPSFSLDALFVNEDICLLNPGEDPFLIATLKMANQDLGFCRKVKSSTNASELLKYIKEKPRAFRYASLRSSRQFRIDALCVSAQVYNDLTQEEKVDREFIMRATKAGIVLEVENESVKAFIKVCRHIMSHRLIKGLPTEFSSFKDDKHLAMLAVEIEPNNLADLSEELQADPEVFVPAVTHNLSVIVHVRVKGEGGYLVLNDIITHLLGEGSFQFTQIQRQAIDVLLTCIHHNPAAVTCIGALMHDRVFVLRAIHANDEVFNVVRGWYQNDTCFLMDAVRANPKVYHELHNPKEYLDRDVALMALLSMPELFEGMHEDLKKDREVITVVARTYPHVISSLDRKSPDYFDILFDVLRHIPEVWPYVPEDLKKNLNFILDVLAMNCAVYQYLEEDLKLNVMVKAQARIFGYPIREGDHFFDAFVAKVQKIREGTSIGRMAFQRDNYGFYTVLEAVKRNGLEICHAGVYKGNEEIALVAIKNDAAAFSHVDDALKTNPQFREKAERLNPRVKEMFEEFSMRKRARVDDQAAVERNTGVWAKPLEQVRGNSDSFQQLDLELIYNEDFVWIALCQNYKVFPLIAEFLLEPRSGLIDMIGKNRRLCDSLQRHAADWKLKVESLESSIGEETKATDEEIDCEFAKLHQNLESFIHTEPRLLSSLIRDPELLVNIGERCRAWQTQLARIPKSTSTWPGADLRETNPKGGRLPQIAQHVFDSPVSVEIDNAIKVFKKGVEGVYLTDKRSNEKYLQDIFQKIQEDETFYLTLGEDSSFHAYFVLDAIRANYKVFPLITREFLDVPYIYTEIKMDTSLYRNITQRHATWLIKLNFLEEALTSQTEVKIDTLKIIELDDDIEAFLELDNALLPGLKNHPEIVEKIRQRALAWDMK